MNPVSERLKEQRDHGTSVFPRSDFMRYLKILSGQEPSITGMMRWKLFIL